MQKGERYKVRRALFLHQTGGENQGPDNTIARRGEPKAEGETGIAMNKE